MEVRKNVIFSNSFDGYEEWKEESLNDGHDENECTLEDFANVISMWHDDECANLNKEVDGVIVMFGTCELWDGVQHGMKPIGTNVKDVIDAVKSCLDVEYYADKYNIRCAGKHHDGTNKYLFRVFDSQERFDRYARSMKKFDEKSFMRASKSLRPCVAEIYGW